MKHWGKEDFLWGVNCAFQGACISIKLETKDRADLLTFVANPWFSGRLSDSYAPSV